MGHYANHTDDAARAHAEAEEQALAAMHQEHQLQEAMAQAHAEGKRAAYELQYASECPYDDGPLRDAWMASRREMLATAQSDPTDLDLPF